MMARRSRSTFLFVAVIAIILIFPFSVLADDESRRLLGLRGADEMGKNPVTPKSHAEVISNGDRGMGEIPIPPPPPPSNITVPLHAHSGSHHVHVYIGSPPQRQILIVDTGSRLMALACRPCRVSTCGKHASSYYDPNLSTTNRRPKCGGCQIDGISTCSLFSDQCEIVQKYTEGSSWIAHELEDMVWLGTNDTQHSLDSFMPNLAIPYAFGCQTSAKGLFRKQYADGILGVARHHSSLIASFRRSGTIPRNAYSLCMTHEGGLMSLGGSLPHSHHMSPMRMVPLVKGKGWYSIEIVRFLVGNIVIAAGGDGPFQGTAEQSVALNELNSGKGAILDSGTTDTYLPKYLEPAITSAVGRITNGRMSFASNVRSQRYTYEDFLRMPEITIEFRNGAMLVLRPMHYMEGVPLDSTQSPARVVPWSGMRTLTNRIYVDEGEGAVLGANAMFDYDVLFDAEGDQVGIAPANCSPIVSGTTSTFS